MKFARILVVDDEPMVLRTLERILEGRGELVLVGSAPAALKALEDGIDLVITDVNLGEGSGVDVARAAKLRKPAMPVIAISGSVEATQLLELGQIGVAAFVAKPFRSEDILEVVEGLEAPRPSELDLVVRRLVGDMPMPEVLDAVRRSMVFEALARSQGNKAHAATLLGISRQNLQNILSRGKV